MLGAGLCGSGASSAMEKPVNLAELAKAKCEHRQRVAQRLALMYAWLGDDKSATAVFALLEVQNRITLTRKFTPGDQAVVAKVLGEKHDEIVQCRALATLGSPLQKGMLTADERKKFHPLVVSYLSHPEPAVRKTAVQIVTGFGDPADYKALVKLSKDSDPNVRDVATRAAEAYRARGWNKRGKRKG